MFEDNFAYFNQLICDSIKSKQFDASKESIPILNKVKANRESKPSRKKSYEEKKGNSKEVDDLIKVKDQDFDNSSHEGLRSIKSARGIRSAFSCRQKPLKFDKLKSLPKKNVMPSFKKAEVQKILEVDLQEDENDDGDDVENQDIFDISCKDIFLEYCSLNKIWIQNVNNRIKSCNKEMNADSDIRASMINFIKIPKLFELYSSKKIKSEYGEKQAKLIKSKNISLVNMLKSKCSQCKISEKTLETMIINSSLVCMLPNFGWMHKECINKYFEETR